MRSFLIPCYLGSLIFLTPGCSKIGNLAGSLREVRLEEETVQTELEEAKTAAVTAEQQYEALAAANPSALMALRSATTEHEHLQQHGEWLNTASAYLKQEVAKLEAAHLQYRKRYLGNAASSTPTP